IMSAIALWGTLHGFGPFSTAHSGEANRSLLLLQTFMGTVTSTVLVLAAVVTERERAEQRLQLQDAVSRVLAESTTLKEATPRVLQALCEVGNWEIGAIWRREQNVEVVSCVEVWHQPSYTAPEFEAVTRQKRFVPGKGLPGRVWSSGK